jgi:beta-glucosidase
MNPNEILQKMTLEEKAALCVGATAWTTTPIEHLGLPEMVVSDGPHGVRHVLDANAMVQESVPATCFPTAACTASTWNTVLIESMGNAIAEEALACGVSVILGPGANMKRSPLCGRNFEYFSEDPFLAGEMAAGLINGLQSKGVGASLKHFAVNNQESHRFLMDAQVDERTLREIYLPAFEKALKKAKPWTVMCAYNKVNGTACSQNSILLTDILKKEWGFGGMVVSDWGAVTNRVKRIEAGLDLEMPGPRENNVKKIIAAVKSGQLAESKLDESALRILKTVLKAAETPKGGKFDPKSHHALARSIAAEGIVLLKNNGILPLKSTRKLAVIGHSAQVAYFQGGGSSRINPTQVDHPLDEIRKAAGSAEVLYAAGYPDEGSDSPEMVAEAAALAKSATAAVIFIAPPAKKESEGRDRTDLDLSAQQVALIHAVTAVQPATVVVLNNSSVLAMNDWINEPAAVLEAYMMGQAGAGAIADILFGKVNPSGKLAETFPLRLSDTPAYINWPGENLSVRYGEGLFIGYRYYDYRQQPVLFPFGHGLSYTTFSYSNPRVSASKCKDTDDITVSVEVTNTGSVAGKEIVQLYLHDQKASLVRPIKELKGFAKVELQPGETKTVSIPLDFRSFAFYNPRFHQWVTEDGDFDVLIGSSSADIRSRLTLTVKSTVQLPCVLNSESTIADWMADARGKTLFMPLFHEMLKAMHIAPLEELPENPDDVSEFLTFLMEMPLVKALGFLNESSSMLPEEKVDQLLKQVAAK